MSYQQPPLPNQPEFPQYHAPQGQGFPGPHQPQHHGQLAPINQGFHDPANSYAPPMNMPAPGYLGPPGRPQDTTLLILLTFVTAGIWGLVWYYRAGEDLKRFTGTGMGGGVHLLLGLFLGIVEDFVLPNEIQHAYDRIGRRSPVSAMTGLWVLFGFWLVIPLFVYIY